MGQITPLKKTFQATIEDRDGWACVVWPKSVTFLVLPGPSRSKAP